MANTLTPPAQSATTSDVLTRVDALERKLSRLTAAGPPNEIVWNATGDLAVISGLPTPQNSSPVWSPPYAARIIGFLLQLHTAGGSDTVVDVIKNGSAVLTLTVPAGLVQWPVSAAIPMAQDSDRMFLNLFSGSGWHLTVQTRYRWVDA